MRHYPLHDLVANAFQVPIHLVNDVNAAAFAEQCSGNAVGCHSLVYTLLSRGVGTGIILRNEIYDTGETGNSIMASAFDDEKTIFQPLNVYSIYNLSKGLRQRYPHEFTDTLDNHSVIDRFFTLAFQQNQDPYLSEAKKRLRTIS